MGGGGRKPQLGLREVSLELGLKGKAGLVAAGAEAWGWGWPVEEALGAFCPQT